jgi:hypothetical protein
VRAHTAFRQIRRYSGAAQLRYIPHGIENLYAPVGSVDINYNFENVYQVRFLFCFFSLLLCNIFFFFHQLLALIDMFIIKLYLYYGCMRCWLLLLDHTFEIDE